MKGWMDGVFGFIEYYLPECVCVREREREREIALFEHTTRPFWEVEIGAGVRRAVYACVYA